MRNTSIPKWSKSDEKHRRYYELKFYGGMVRLFWNDRCLANVRNHRKSARTIRHAGFKLSYIRCFWGDFDELYVIFLVILHSLFWWQTSADCFATPEVENRFFLRIFRKPLLVSSPKYLHTINVQCRVNTVEIANWISIQQLAIS